MANEIQVFQGPFSYLELLSGQNLKFVPAKWEFGNYTFTPAGRPQKTVQGVRIWLSQKGLNNYRGLPYIDIGQQKIMFQLRPLLDKTIPDLFEYSITAMGSAPTTEYSVSVSQLA